MSLKRVFCRHNSKLQNEPNQAAKHILIFSAKIKRKDWKAYLNCYLGCVGDKVFRSWVVFKIPFHLVQIVSRRHFEWYSFPASRMICWERFGIVGKGNLECEIGLCICFLYFHFCNIHTSRLLRLNSFILFYLLFGECQVTQQTWRVCHSFSKTYPNASFRKPALSYFLWFLHPLVTQWHATTRIILL